MLRDRNVKVPANIDWKSYEYGYRMARKYGLIVGAIAGVLGTLGAQRVYEYFTKTEKQEINVILPEERERVSKLEMD